MSKKNRMKRQQQEDQGSVSALVRECCVKCTEPLLPNQHFSRLFQPVEPGKRDPEKDKFLGKAHDVCILKENLKTAMEQVGHANVAAMQANAMVGAMLAARGGEAIITEADVKKSQEVGHEFQMAEAPPIDLTGGKAWKLTLRRIAPAAPSLLGADGKPLN